MWIVKIYDGFGKHIGYFRNKGKVEKDINQAKTFKLEKDARYRARYTLTGQRYSKDQADHHRAEAVEVTVTISEKPNEVQAIPG